MSGGPYGLKFDVYTHVDFINNKTLKENKFYFTHKKTLKYYRIDRKQMINYLWDKIKLYFVIRYLEIRQLIILAF